MPEDTPLSPADELPSILEGNEDDPALALLAEGEEEDAPTPEEDGADEDEGGTVKVDKALQKRQQDVANREKAVLAAQEKLDKTAERLEQLAAKLEANPSPANAQAVKVAERQSVVAQAKVKIAELKADPKFDRYADGDKIDAIWLEAMESIESGQAKLETDTAAEKARTAEERNHEKWWNAWAAKNPELGRSRGEKLWDKAYAQAKAEQKTAMEEGLPLTEGQAAMQVFRRLVAVAKKSPAPTPKKEPEESGGRLGPGAGRSGGSSGHRDPLDEIYSDTDFAAGKYGRLTG